MKSKKDKNQLCDQNRVYKTFTYRVFLQMKIANGIEPNSMVVAASFIPETIKDLGLLQDLEDPASTFMIRHYYCSPLQVVYRACDEK
uniref:Uncharacterized protein n=1 Tax=Romanomermis culicivorax TaxID=13658 RepID=A0A915IFB2_ROMCU